MSTMSIAASKSSTIGPSGILYNKIRMFNPIVATKSISTSSFWLTTRLAAANSSELLLLNSHRRRLLLNVQSVSLHGSHVVPKSYSSANYSDTFPEKRAKDGDRAKTIYNERQRIKEKLISSPEINSDIWFRDHIVLNLPKDHLMEKGLSKDIIRDLRETYKSKKGGLTFDARFMMHVKSKQWHQAGSDYMQFLTDNEAHNPATIKESVRILFAASTSLQSEHHRLARKDGPNERYIEKLIEITANDICYASSFTILLAATGQWDKAVKQLPYLRNNPNLMEMELLLTMNAIGCSIVLSGNTEDALEWIKLMINKFDMYEGYLPPFINSYLLLIQRISEQGDLEKTLDVMAQMFNNYILFKQQIQTNELKSISNILQKILSTPSAKAARTSTMKEVEIQVHENANTSRRVSYCSDCKQILPSYSIAVEDYEELRTAVLRHVMTKQAWWTQVYRNDLERYKILLERSRANPFDIFIDGLNIYYWQADAERQKARYESPHELHIKRLNRLNKAVEYLTGELGFKRPLIVIRYHTVRKSQEYYRILPPERVTTFTVDNDTKDDPFYLYGAMTSGRNCLILTNDRLAMEGSHLNLRQRKLFQDWLAGHQIIISDMDSSRSRSAMKGFMLPHPHRVGPHCIRNAETGEINWHLPYSDKLEERFYETPFQWLCFNSKLRSDPPVAASTSENDAAQDKQKTDEEDEQDQKTAVNSSCYLLDREEYS